MRILVPVDGSESANRAATYAVRLAEGRPEAEIVLLNVQNQETLDTSEVSRITSVGADTKRAAEQSEKAFRHATELCRKAKVKLDTRTAVGRIAETINAVAREAGADQIVMGTRGLGLLRGVVLGSVSSRVVQLAPVPVTLVK